MDHQGLYEAYQEIYYNEQNFIDDAHEFLYETNIFRDDLEIGYFIQSLFEEDLVYTFLEDILDFYHQANLTEESASYITEVSAGLIKKGLQVAGGIFKKAIPAVRGLPAKTLVKRGIKPGGLSSKGESLRKYGDSLKTDTNWIRKSRAERQVGASEPYQRGINVERSRLQAGLPRKSEAPGKYLELLKNKKELTKTTPPTPSTPESPKSFVQRGWERHTAAGGPSPSEMAKAAKRDAIISALATTLHMAGIKPLPVAQNVARMAPAPIQRTVNAVKQGGENIVKNVKTRYASTNPKLSDPWDGPSAPSSPVNIQRGGTPSGGPSGPRALPAAGQTSAPKPSNIQLPREIKKGSHRAPIPAWGPDAAPGQAQRNIINSAPTQKPAAKPVKKTPEPSTGGGQPPTGKKPKGINKGLVAATVGGAGAASIAAATRLAQIEKEKQAKRDAEIKRNIKTDVYNTRDYPSVEVPSGQIRSRLKVGSREVGTTFNDAYKEAQRKRREARRIGDQIPTTFYYGGKEYSVDESYLIDYLLGEGFASDEKSAYGIMEGMSEQWIENILDSY